MLHAQGGAQPDFLCVWSEAYAGMQDGAAGFFYVPLARVGDTLRRDECFLTRQVLWRRMVGRSPPALADGGPAAYMDLSPVLEDTRSPLSFL